MYPQYIVLFSYKKDIILDSRTLILSFDKRSFGNEVKKMHQKCYFRKFHLNTEAIKLRELCQRKGHS